MGAEPRRATRQAAEAVDAVYRQVTTLLSELRAAIQRYCGHGYGGAEPY